MVSGCARQVVNPRLWGFGYAQAFRETERVAYLSFTLIRFPRCSNVGSLLNTNACPIGALTDSFFRSLDFPIFQVSQSKEERNSSIALWGMDLDQLS